ncbi:MAG TPA: autotransporter-associated beta strand repeat-containing protein, partial [Roseomonas sp.]
MRKRDGYACGHSSRRRHGYRAPSATILYLTGAALVPALLATPARAANLQAGSETELRAAIAMANGSADPSSTITLTGNVTITNPALLPALAKPLTINTGGFTLQGATGGNALAWTGGTITITGSGSVVGGAGSNRDAGAGTGTVGAAGNGLVINGVTLDNGSRIIGGAGGSIVNAPGNAAGQVGAAGGTGLVMTGGSAVNTINGSIQGGLGGLGATIGDSGHGAGGLGLNLSGGGTFVNNGVIVGGDGRPGGGTTANTGSAGGGGAIVTDSTLENNFSIIGGDGGNDGAGGVAIIATRSRIINSDTIEGGTGGPDGDAADAIRFNGGGNVLELRGGFTITGNVIAGATDTLVLGGTSNDSFSMSDVGAAAQYRGFGAFEKTGTSTWTLTGSTATVTPWTIHQGTLSVAGDGALGATSGTLTIDGGILRVTGTGFTSTPRPIILGNNGGGFDIAAAGATFTVAQILGGNGPIEKLGAGTLILTGTNTYAGGTTISAGTLQLGNGGTTGGIQ